MLRDIFYVTSITLTMVLAIANINAIVIGLYDGMHKVEAKRWHRIEYIVPGYKIGWWLSQ